MTTKTIDLVIARYNEKLDWLKDYSSYKFNRVFLYNKGESNVELPESFRPLEPLIYEKLPNVGRCDHTYIHHIIKHYNNLGDVTIFIVSESKFVFTNLSNSDKVYSISPFGNSLSL
jgi:hypothetical protein